MGRPRCLPFMRGERGSPSTSPPELEEDSVTRAGCPQRPGNPDDLVAAARGNRYSTARGSFSRSADRAPVSSLGIQPWSPNEVSGVRLVPRAGPDPLRAACRASERRSELAPGRALRPRAVGRRTRLPPSEWVACSDASERRDPGLRKQGFEGRSVRSDSSRSRIRRKPGRTEHLSRTKPQPSSDPIRTG